MGKETKDLLKKIISSQEMIMKHLKISVPAKSSKLIKTLRPKKETETVRRMPTVKSNK